MRLGHLAKQIPDEAAEFAGEGHVDLSFHDAALEQMTAAFMQPKLCFPGEFAIACRLSLLALCERR